MPRRGAPRAALPFAAASGTRSPGTPPLPAGLDRLATAQGGHHSAFSQSPRPCTRPSALRGPPTPGKARPHTPIGRSRRTSLVQLVEPSPLPDRPDGSQLQVGLQNCEVPEAWVCGLWDLTSQWVLSGLFSSVYFAFQPPFTPQPELLVLQLLNFTGLSLLVLAFGSGQEQVRSHLTCFRCTLFQRW